jgi:arylsulfatase A-like enzyme
MIFYMKLFSIFVVLCCTLAPGSAFPLNADDAETNTPSGDHILLITIDDLNDWIGCLSDPTDPANTTGMVTGQGHPQASTPNMDRLAQRGILFTNAHCQAPMCRPSRGSFLSGLRPSDTGLYANNPKHDAKGTITPGKDVPWLTRRFESAGYQSFAAGKVLHGSNKQLSNHPAPSTSQGPYPNEKMNVPASVTRHGVWDYGPYPEMERFTDWRNAQWIMQHISAPNDDDQPRFLALGFYRPHVPLFAPQQYFDQAPALEDVILGANREDDFDDLPEIAERLPSRVLFKDTTRWVLEDQKRLRGLTQAYLACTSAMDDCLGKVLDELDESGMAENTWIVVFSDHGWHLGEKNHVAKQTLWQRSTRVPLIIVPPARLKDLPRGKRCNQPVELIDVYPTLLEATQIESQPSDAKLAGLSLLPWLRNPDAPRDRPALTTLYSGNHSVCDQTYRFIQYADGSQELYNRDKDPHEFDNLIPQIDDDAALKAVVDRLSAWLPKEQAGQPDLILDN